MRKVGSMMTMGITVPTAVAAYQAAKLASNFESTMVKINTLAGASEQQIQAWSKQLLDLGPKLGVGPEELADGLYYVMSSGTQAADAIDVLTASAKAAAVGLGTTQTVADAVTSALNAYGSANISATQATDFLMRAVKNGKGEANEIASSIGLVIPLASQLGVGFGDVAAGMAAITQTGANASEASTQLRGIFASILDPSMGTADALKQFGLSADGVRKTLREKGLLATLQMLKGVVGENEQAWGQLFPNVRGMLGVMSLVGANGAGVAAVFDDVKNSTEGVDQAFDRTEKTSAHRMQVALATIKSRAIELGQMMAPAVEVVAAVFDKVSSALSRLSEEQKKSVARFIGILAVVGPILYVFGSLSRMFYLLSKHPIFAAVALLILLFANLYANNEKFRKAVNNLASNLSSLVAKMWEHRDAIAAVAGGLAAFLTTARAVTALQTLIGVIKALNVQAVIANISFKALATTLKTKLVKAAEAAAAALRAMGLASITNPIGFAIAAIAALAVAFYIAYKRSESFRNFVNSALKKVGEAAGWLKDRFFEFVESAKKWFGTYLKGPLTEFKNVVTSAFDKIVGGVQKVWPHIKRFVDFLSSKFSGSGGKISGTIGKILGGLVRFATGIAKVSMTVVASIGRAFMAIGRFLAPVVAVIAKVIGVVVKVIWKIVSVVYAALLPGIKFATMIFTWLFKVVLWSFEAIWAVVSGVLKLIWAFVRPMLVLLFEFFKMTWTGIFKTIKLVVRAVIMVVKLLAAGIKMVWNTLKILTLAAWKAIKKYIVDPVVSAAKAVSKFIGDIVKWVVAKFNWLVLKARIYWAAISGFITGQARAIYHRVMSFIQPLVNWVMSKFRWLMNALRPLWNLFYKYIVDPTMGLYLRIMDIIHTMVLWVLDKFRWVKDLALDIWRDLVSGIAGMWDAFTGVFSGGFKGIVNGLIGGINWVIRKINSLSIPEVKVAGKVVFDGWKGLNLPQIPYMANGGFVDKATVAMIGEAGRELVVPLTRPERALDLLRQSGLLQRPEARRSLGGPVGGAGVDRSVTIQKMVVNTTPADPKDIGREILWSLRAAAL